MSWQNTLLSAFLRARVKPKTRGELDLGRLRRHADSPWLTLMPRPAAKIELLGDKKSALCGESVEPRFLSVPARRSRTVLYLHGGGYFACSPRTHRSVTCALADGAAAKVFAIDYRLSPENPFPAALDDSLAAYRGLLARGCDPKHIVLAGDSAGGGLALATLVALRDSGSPLPAGAVLFSPWTDLACTGTSLQSNAHKETMFAAEAVSRCARAYLGDAPADTPLASPVYADLRRLPPLLIQVSDSEALLDDSLRVATRARAAGVEVTLRTWRGVPHAWHVFAPLLPEARRALREACSFIRRVT